MGWGRGGFQEQALYTMHQRKRTGITLIALIVCAGGWTLSARGESWTREDVNLNIAPGLHVTAINRPRSADRLFAPQAPQPAPAMAAGPIPIAGFVPYIAVALTDRRKGFEFEWAHVLANSVVGSPLNQPMSQGYAIGILDTGGTISIVGHCDRTALGLTDPFLTGNTIPVGGAGGQVDADVSWTLGLFVAGLQAIDPVTLNLDTAQLTGHWNVSVAIPQEPACNDIVDIPTAVGTPLFAFRDFAIYNDRPVTITRNGKTYTGPEVEIFLPGDPNAPEYDKVIPLDPRPPGMTTSAYYPNILELDFRTPWIPTALATVEGDLPQGAWFVASVWLQEGSRPAVNKYFMVDTGAQISLMRSFIAGQLGLNPNNPEFTVEVTGVAGDVHEAPGFYLDTLEIDAFGGPVSFRQVPIIVEDVPSVEGGTLDGIVGTNAFQGRNLVFRPRLTGNSTLEITMPNTYGDFDGDGDVDLSDFNRFAACFNGPNQPPAFPGFCDATDADGDGDADLADFLRFSACFNGPNNPPVCQ